MKRPEVVKKWQAKMKPQYKRGKEHVMWRGGTEIDAYGYRWVYAPEHPAAHKNKVKEHRLVMEQKLGRLLLPTEIVHHINGDKLDNRIENLVLTTRKAHIKLHKPHLHHG